MYRFCFCESATPARTLMPASRGVKKKEATSICSWPHYCGQALACLAGAHIPLDQTARLALGITAPAHSLQEVRVLLLILFLLFLSERDDGKQVLELSEHFLF